MTIPPPFDARRPAAPFRAGASIVLLILGLLGHLYAAHAIGGSRVAYVHHVLGYLLILVVTGAIIAGLGWRFWRSRADITLLLVGIVQALFGLLVALAPARAAGGG
jgi:hypothetical protein